MRQLVDVDVCDYKGQIVEGWDMHSYEDDGDSARVVGGSDTAVVDDRVRAPVEAECTCDYKANRGDCLEFLLVWKTKTAETMMITML